MGSFKSEVLKEAEIESLVGAGATAFNIVQLEKSANGALAWWRSWILSVATWRNEYGIVSRFYGGPTVARGGW